jgi:hypothetical protein
MGRSGFVLLNIPVLHHSNDIPNLIPYVLRKPFKRQRVAEASYFGEVVGGAADGGELQTLCALVV